MGSQLVLGDALAAWRKEKGWSQKDLATKLEIRPSYMNDLERNRRDPSPETIEKIAALFGVAPGIVYAYARKIPPQLLARDAFIIEMARLITKYLEDV